MQTKLYWSTWVAILSIPSFLLTACGSVPVGQFMPTLTNAPTRARSASPIPRQPIQTAAPVNPLAIAYLQAREYPPSDLVMEETLDAGSNYQRYIASYQSDGDRIYGLLTIPDKDSDLDGYAAIVLLHGYIPPESYVTTRDYVSSQDGLASSGFVTFKPDMRGHGRSEGEADGAHFSETYIVDTLHAISALEAYEAVDPARIGIWGHSNGGLIGLRAIVVTERVKASVFWGGVVGSYTDMLETYYPQIDFLQRLAPPVITEHGLPSENPDYWNSIDPFAHLDAVSDPVEIHHGISDSDVPVELSVSLYMALRDAGREATLFTYPGAGHNFYGETFDEAMRRTVTFFQKHL